MDFNFPAGGGAEIDGKKLSEKQLGGLVQELVRRGMLPHYTVGTANRKAVRAIVAQLAGAVEAGDRDAALAALGELFQATRDPFGVLAAPTQTSARVPTAEDVPGALRRAVGLLKAFPLQTLPVHREPAEVEAQAARIEGQIAYEAGLSAEATHVQKSIVACSQEADGWLRNLWGLCEAAAPTTPGLAEASAFLGTFFTEAAERAQVTRQIVDRVRSETTTEVTDAVYEQARTEARDELRDKLDERFRDLLDK